MPPTLGYVPSGQERNLLDVWVIPPKRITGLLVGV
jgi:hypothetical protein